MWPCSAREGSAALPVDMRKWCVNIAALDAEDVGNRVDLCAFFLKWRALLC
jgi:hypothetical protein